MLARGDGCVEKVTVTKPDQNNVAYSLTLNNGSSNTLISCFTAVATSKYVVLLRENHR